MQEQKKRAGGWTRARAMRGALESRGRAAHGNDRVRVGHRGLDEHDEELSVDGGVDG